MKVRGELAREVHTAALSDWHVGGVAKFVFTPADAGDLATFLAALRIDEPLLALGGGSRTVVRDGGFDGVVLNLRSLAAMRRSNDNHLYAEAGASCAKVARYAAVHAIAGLNWLAGVPGTMAGSLATNAGDGTHRLWSHVAAVHTVDRLGRTHRRVPESFGVGAVHAGSRRHADEVIIGVWLHAGAAEASRSEGRSLIGPRAVSRLFATEDVDAVLAVAGELTGAITVDPSSGQLQLGETPSATLLEQAMRQLCSAASKRTGRPVHCRLRFVGAIGCLEVAA